MLLIYTTGGGRFGNQAITHAHLLAFWLECDERVTLVNTGFWPYAKFLESGRDNPLCVYRHGGVAFAGVAKWLGNLREFEKSLPKGPANFSKLQAWINIAATKIPGTYLLNLDDMENCLQNGVILDRLFGSPVTVLAGWPVRCWDLLHRHRNAVRKLLEPARGFARIADSFVGQLRGQYDELVGILIRQDDYRDILSGRFFYPSGKYVEWIRQWLDLNPHVRTGFIIASDEAQDPLLFAGLPVHFATGISVGVGHWMESLLELAKCDVILSPPSTFSAWAAFIGERPLLPLVSEDQVIALDDILDDPLFQSVRHEVLSLVVQ